MSERQEFLGALNAVRATAARLPSCDRAARLHALLARVGSQTDNGSAVATSATELVRLAVAALEDDPWVQFEKAARRLLDIARTDDTPLC